MSLLKPVSKFVAGVLALVVIAEFAYAVLLRPEVMRWGATDQEVQMAMPGDGEIKPDSVVDTRAITINAPASKVWPWVAMLGQERGGFFSYTFFENVFGSHMVNAEAVLPESQWIKVGDRYSFIENGPAGTYAIVDIVEPGRALAVDGWSYLLQPIDDHTTRLVVRYPYQPGTAMIGRVYYYLMLEQAHFIMESGMLMGIKQRAEMSALSQ